MTLKEVIDLSMKGIEPDKKTTDNNIKNLEQLKNNLNDEDKQKLEAVAAELKAHKQAKNVEQVQSQTKPPVSDNPNKKETAETNIQPETAQSN